MAGYRSGGRGSIIIQMALPGVGKIRRASGTDSPSEVAVIKAMMQDAAKAGDTMSLVDVKEGRISPLAWYQSRVTGKIPLPKKINLLIPSFERWLEDYPNIKEKTRKDYWSAWTVFKGMIPEGVAINSLPSYLRQYKQIKRDTPRFFNVTRNIFRAYARHTQGKNSNLYRGVEDITPLPEKTESRDAPSPQDVYTLSDMRSNAWDTFRGLYLTGQGLTEWNGGLVEEDDHYLVQGKKVQRIDTRRHRKIPKIVDGLPSFPPLQQKALRTQLHKRGDWQVYDARRGYARLLLEAGIPEFRVQQYMGHQAKNITLKYAQAAPDDFLVKDAEEVRKYLGSMGITP